MVERAERKGKKGVTSAKSKTLIYSKPTKLDCEKSRTLLCVVRKKCRKESTYSGTHTTLSELKKAKDMKQTPIVSSVGFAIT